MSDIEATSAASTASDDPSNPTRFISSRRVTFPQGEKVLNLLTWTEDVLPVNMICDTETIACGVFMNHRFSGTFYVKIAISGVPIPLESTVVFEL